MTSPPKLGAVGHPPPATLVEDLGELADSFSDLEAEFGLRPERAFVVRYAWSGKEVGAGKPTRELEKEILPRPVFAGVVGYENDHGTGLTPRGSPRLEGLSPRFVEADLDPMLAELGPGQEILIEVLRDRRDGRQPMRHPFRAQGRPQRRADSFDFVLPLTAVEDPRTVEGKRRDWSKE